MLWRLLRQYPLTGRGDFLVREGLSIDIWWESLNCSRSMSMASMTSSPAQTGYLVGGAEDGHPVFDTSHHPPPLCKVSHYVNQTIERWGTAFQ